MVYKFQTLDCIIAQIAYRCLHKPDDPPKPQPPRSDHWSTHDVNARVWSMECARARGVNQQKRQNSNERTHTHRVSTRRRTTTTPWTTSTKWFPLVLQREHRFSCQSCVCVCMRVCVCVCVYIQFESFWHNLMKRAIMSSGDPSNDSPGQP